MACSCIGVSNKDFRQCRMLIQLARFAGDVRGLVGDALEIRAQFHRRNHPAKIGRDRLKTQQQFDSILVDLFFQLIDFFVVGNGKARRSSSSRSIKPLECAVEAALGLTRHHHDVVAQIFERVLEGSQCVFAFAWHSY